jgi:hypothetical protein
MFQSENTKSLNFEDRQKLSYILKSYDEKTPIAVDTSRKQIIFPAAVNPAPTPKFNPTMNNAPVSESIHNMDGASYAQKPFANETAKPAPIDSQKKPYDNSISKPVYDIDQDYQRYHIPQEKPTPAVQENTIHEKGKMIFSAAQKFPYEKEAEEKNTPPTPPIQPKPAQDMPKPTEIAKPAAKPIIISPASSYEEEENTQEELPRNVVNLRK